MSVAAELEDSPEYRGDRAVQTLELLDRLDASGSFGDIARKNEFLDSLSKDGYVEWVRYINSFISGDPETRTFAKPELQWIPDGMEQYVEYVPPIQGREELLDEILETAQELNRIDGPDRERRMFDIGLLLGGGTTHVHPFRDGNGRLGRLVAHLFGLGYRGAPEERMLLMKQLVDGEEPPLNANPGFILGELIDETAWRMYQHAQHRTAGGVNSVESLDIDYPLQYTGDNIGLNPSLPEADRDRFAKLMAQYLFAPSYLTPFLKRTGLWENEPEKCLVTDPTGARRVVLPLEKVARRITASDLPVIFEEAERFKREYIRTFSDMYRRPDDYLRYLPNGTLYRLKDLYGTRAMGHNLDQNPSIKVFPEDIEK